MGWGNSRKDLFLLGLTQWHKQCLKRVSTRVPPTGYQIFLTSKYNLFKTWGWKKHFATLFGRQEDSVITAYTLLLLPTPPLPLLSSSSSVCGASCCFFCLWSKVRKGDGWSEREKRERPRSIWGFSLSFGCTHKKSQVYSKKRSSDLLIFDYLHSKNITRAFFLWMRVWEWERQPTIVLSMFLCVYAYAHVYT